MLISSGMRPTECSSVEYSCIPILKQNANFNIANPVSSDVD